MKTKSSKPTPIGGVAPTASSAPLKHIESACGVLASEHAHLGVMITRLDDRVRSLRLELMPHIRRQAEAVAIYRAAIFSLVDTNRPLFEKPRTRIFSDIKVGLQKQKGDTVIQDEDKTLELIERHFPDRLDDLAPAKRKISKTALANLTAAELKKIGVEITADTDAVLIKPQDSDVEKAVAALLEETQCSVLSPQSLKKAA